MASSSKGKDKKPSKKTKYPSRNITVDELTSRLENGEYRFHPVLPTCKEDFLESSVEGSYYFPVFIQDTMPETPKMAIFRATVEGFIGFTVPFGLSSYTDPTDVTGKKKRYTIQLKLSLDDSNTEEERRGIEQLRRFCIWYYDDHLEKALVDPSTNLARNLDMIHKEKPTFDIFDIREKCPNPLYPRKQKEYGATLKVQCKQLKDNLRDEYQKKWNDTPPEGRKLSENIRQVFTNNGIALYTLFLEIPKHQVCLTLIF